MGDACQEIVAGITSLLLEGAAMSLGSGLYIFLGSGKGEVEGLGLRGNVFGVCVRGIGAEAVVEVGDMEGET